MKELLNLVKIDVSIEYAPKVYVYSRGSTWYWKFLLPNNTWFAGRAPGKDKKSVDRNAVLKERDLVKGLFNQKEIEKLQKTSHTLVTFTVAIKSYIEALKMEGASPNYYVSLEKQLVAVAKTFRNEHNILFVHKVDEEAAYSFRQSLLKRVQDGEIARPTAYRILNDAKRLFKWLKRRKMIHQNPWIEIDAISVPQEQKVRTKAPCKDIIPLLMAAEYSHPYEFPIKEFAYSLFRIGPRLHELLYMEIDDVDWETGIWNIRTKKCPNPYGMMWSPKNRKSRTALLSKDVLDLLQPLLRRALDHKVVGYAPNALGVIQPIEAKFIFTMLDRSASKNSLVKVYRRVDDIRGAWNALFASVGLTENFEANKLLCTNGNSKSQFGGYERAAFTSHDMRRGFNLAAIEAGMSLDDRALLLGHGRSVNEAHYCGKPALDTAKIAHLINHKMNFDCNSK